MLHQPFSRLVRYKRWADRGLYEVLDRSFGNLPAEDRAVLLRILDHFHVVDRIFQHHLLGIAHAFRAARSDSVPDLPTLARGVTEVDDWYDWYVGGLREQDLEQTVDIAFTNGTMARMRRGDIILHVCLHGTYHRGNAGIVLQKNGVVPNRDAMTDFLEASA
jgi:uncharacterized damage-inducible protein DinB